MVAGGGQWKAIFVEQYHVSGYGEGCRVAPVISLPAVCAVLQTCGIKIDGSLHCWGECSERLEQHDHAPLWI